MTAPKPAPTHCRHCGKRLRRQNQGRGRKLEYCSTAHRHAFWRALRVKARQLLDQSLATVNA